MTGLKARSADYTAMRVQSAQDCTGDSSMADSAVDPNPPNANGAAPVLLTFPAASDDGSVVKTFTADPPLGEGGGVGTDGGDGGGGSKTDDDYDCDRYRCQWGPVRPLFCNKFRSPAWFLVCLCIAGAIQGMVVNGFVNVVISTVERRFEISSTESGTIASCYDIAAVVCLIPVSYFGGRARKPFYLAVGFVIMGIGSFVFTLPHFITSLYEVGEAQNTVCSVAGGNATTSSSPTCSLSESSGSGLSDFKYFFFAGQLLHGVGASPLYTLGVTYLDENLPTRSVSLYQGIFYTSAIFGPGLGYLAGGAFLQVFTDIDRLDTVPNDINSDNPRWVGAWWLGFLISGTLAMLIALPIFGFPTSLPGSDKYLEEKEKEVFKSSSDSTKTNTSSEPLGLRHIWTSFKMLLTNPTFMFLNLAAASEGCIVSGLSTFGPKFFEFQFGLQSGVAAQYVGLVAIPGGGLGTFLGGYLVKRFNWDMRTIIKFSIIATLVAVGFGLIFLISCDNMRFAGITNSDGGLLDKVDFNGSCNGGCGCSLYNYNPVCGRDHIMYYSPCHAGCSASYTKEAKKYSGCDCVDYNATAADMSGGSVWGVEEGKCLNDCPYLVFMLVAIGFFLIFVFITAMPALTATLRCVTMDQRSFALGIQWIIARSLGSIPGPILFGKMFDLTCLVWQQSCGEESDGACLYYDNRNMSLNLLALITAGNLFSCVFFFLALFFYRSSSKSSIIPANTNTTGDVTLEVTAPSGDAISQQTHMTSLTQPNTPSAEHPPSLSVNGDTFTPLALPPGVGSPEPQASSDSISSTTGR